MLKRCQRRNADFDHRRGTTLVEVAFSILLVSVILLAALQTIGAVYRARATAVTLSDGAALSKQLLTEVMQSYYEDPEEPGEPMGRESDETYGSRQDWDDVDD